MTLARQGTVEHRTGSGRMPEDPFATLTWGDVGAWVGARVLGRGRTYERRGVVEALARTREGELIAWVRGGKRYATAVARYEGKFTSRCACPYGTACKHAVAVIVAYLRARAEGRAVDDAAGDDPRLQALATWSTEGHGEEGDDRLDADDDAEGDALIDRIHARGRRGTGRAPERMERARTAGQGTPDLHAYLTARTKEELAVLIEDLRARHDVIREELADRMLLANAESDALVMQVRKDIDGLDAEAWAVDGAGGDLRDAQGYCDRIARRLTALLSAGQADAVVALGEHLIERGTALIEQLHDEDWLMGELTGCLTVVFDALARSSRAPAEQMVCAVCLELLDQYELCADGAKQFWSRSFDRRDWSACADLLLEALRATPCPGGPHDQWSSERYRRDRLGDRIVTALERAERTADAITFGEAEVPVTRNYLRLVTLLRRAGRTDDATTWVRRGITAMRDLPGVVADLRNARAELCADAEDWTGVATMRAEEFFAHPSPEAYAKLREASERAGVWTAVRGAALRYLETGALPPAGSHRGARESERGDWPLDEPVLPNPKDTPRERAPIVPVLIDVALAEGRVGDALTWYDRWDRTRISLPCGWERHADALADAALATQPDRACAIWQDIIGSVITGTDTHRYESAVPYLRKLRAAFDRLEHPEAWGQYLAELRTVHRRRRRFLEILDMLTGRPITEELAAQRTSR